MQHAAKSLCEARSIDLCREDSQSETKSRYCTSATSDRKRLAGACLVPERRKDLVLKEAQALPRQGGWHPPTQWVEVDER